MVSIRIGSFRVLRLVVRGVERIKLGFTSALTVFGIWFVWVFVVRSCHRVCLDCGKVMMKTTARRRAPQESDKIDGERVGEGKETSVVEEATKSSAEREEL